MAGFVMEDMVVQGPRFRKEEGMQESDLLDLLPDGEAQADSGTDHVMVVSLGCYCGPKLSFKHIGRGSETLPFDWMRTRGRGILRFMRSDFDGFFDFVSKVPVPGCNMTTFRGYHHSFWHDDPSDPGMRARYGRRIARFRSLESSTRPILFVRTIPSTDELFDVPELVEEIVSRYGKHACLLLIIDFQGTAQGAAIVDGIENLMVYYLPSSFHAAKDGKPPAPPYSLPVLCALDWMVGRPVSAIRFPDFSKAIACADVTHWGLEGLGGLKAFEAAEGFPDEEDLARVVPLGASVIDPQPLSSAELEQQGTQGGAGVSGLAVVSLGCTPAAKLTLQEMGMGAEALPFDWLRVSHDGLLHFLHRGFEAPIREGLGAGNQRPTERHGFLDVMVRRPLSGSTMPLCRSHLHSLCHDDVGDPAVRASLFERVATWSRLGQDGRGLLFLRAVTTSAELARADELLSALARRFGPSAALLVVVDFQTNHEGPHVVEGLEDLLVFFLDKSAHEGGSRTAPYRKPVECALGWMRGEELPASSHADLSALSCLAEFTNWGQFGPGGMPMFEGLVDRGPAEPQEAPGGGGTLEQNWLEDAKMESAKDALALVSLGCVPAIAAALDLTGHGAEEGPFDATRIGLDGVMHFLLTDFRDYLDVSPPDPIPNSPMVVRRSCFHAFCDAFPEDSWRGAYQKVVDGLVHLARSSRQKLFFHACASAEELGRLNTLLEELMVYFGQAIFLVVFVGCQPEAKTLSVEGNFKVLVHFLPDRIGMDTDPKCLLPPIRRSLDWAVGRATKVSVVEDVSALRNLAKPFRVDMASGFGGKPAFAEAGA